MSENNKGVFDVIVVGGGLAGLRSAQLLEAKGYSVQVIEARDRVGGRTNGIEYDNYQWDLGGQWIGPTHDRMYRLLEELDMKYFPQNMKGKKAYFHPNGKVTFYSGEIPSASFFALIDLQIFIWTIANLVNQFPTDKRIDIWNHPQAKEWDSLTVEAWANQTMWSKEGKALLNQIVNGLLTVESSEVSLLYWVHFTRGATKEGYSNGMNLLISVEEGAQQDRIVGGAYSVSQNLEKKLKNPIAFNQPVNSIEQKSDEVIVTTRSGSIFRGKYIVIACAPLLTNSIRYEPPLPTIREEFACRMPVGKVIKCLAFYKDNFWRKKGYSGEFLSEEIINMGYEATLQDDSHPGLVGFICGQQARYWSDKPKEERKQAVLEYFSRFFGEEALYPVHYMDLDWCREEFSKGGYTSVCGPGNLTTCGNALREPIGRIHWAGTETARVWTAYMEGALESAERVTEEIDARLQGKSIPKPPKVNWKPLNPRPYSLHQNIVLCVIVAILSFLLSKIFC